MRDNEIMREWCTSFQEQYITVLKDRHGDIVLILFHFFSYCHSYFPHLQLPFCLFLYVVLQPFLVLWLGILFSRTATNWCWSATKQPVASCLKWESMFLRMLLCVLYFVLVQNGPVPFLKTTVMEAMNDNQGFG